MQLILEQNLLAEKKAARAADPNGHKIGLFASLFGCWHKRLTRPFTSDRRTYMACVECGARRMVDTKNFKVSRAFYYPPSVTFDRN
ncbi:MAG TPA: hypothetical protein PKD26_10985 [Pyrinomonadaceae bacterium]|nr:hypothetical protein [Pyrinomonadaceae bacterium]